MRRRGKNRFNRINKKGQETLGISFGVIFSIILIVFFIIVAFIVINSFLGTKKCAEVGIFIDRLESDVDRTWNSQGAAFEFKGVLPSSIDYICFANLTKSFRGSNDLVVDIWDDITLYEGREANMFFYPTANACEIPFKQIDHLDLNKITFNSNPNCIPVEKGRVSFTLEKGLNDRFVNVIG